MHERYAGWHLSYDALVDPECAVRLTDLEFLCKTLCDLAELLEMEALVGPVLRGVPTSSEEGSGGTISGAVIGEGTHIVFHTWPRRNRFTLDLFSSRKFNGGSFEEFLSGRFNVKTRASRWAVRNWP